MYMYMYMYGCSIKNDMLWKEVDIPLSVKK